MRAFENAHAPVLNNCHLTDVARDSYANSTVVFNGSKTVAQILDDSGTIAIGALHNSQERSREGPPPKCSPETRVELLTSIRDWLDNTSGSPIFWLHGRAGTGKSCIAQSIAEYYADRRRLAASFFFDWQFEQRKRTDRVIPTICYQLATSKPPVLSVTTLKETLDRQPRIFGLDLYTQAQELIRIPLETVSSCTEHKIIVIDSLDDCDEHETVLERLVSQISALAQTLCSPNSGHIPLRFLITSRPNHRIKKCFKGIQPHSFTPVELGCNQDDERAEIRHFLETSLKDCDLSQEELDKLVDDSNGLYIYASIIQRVMTDDRTFFNLQERLDRVQRGPDLEPLNGLYAQILSASPYNPLHPGHADTQKIVNTIILLFNPLPLKEIENLLQFSPGQGDFALRELHSVFVVPEENPVQAYHSTFQEFLRSNEVPGDMSMNASTHHAVIATHCLELVTKELKLRVAGQGDIKFGKDSISVATWYACRFWAAHLTVASFEPCDRLIKALNNFVQHSLSDWMEVLIVLDDTENIHDIVTALQIARGWLRKACHEPSQNIEYLLEAERSFCEYIFSPRRCDNLPVSNQ